MVEKFLPGFLENIFVNAPIGIFTTDLTRSVTTTNQLTVNLHGFYRMDEFIGKTFPEVIGRPVPVIETLQQVLYSSLDKADIKYEITVGNETKTIRLISTLLRDERYAPIGLLNMCEDITEEKKLADKVKEYTHGLEKMVQEKTKELQETNLLLIHSERLRLLGNLVVSVAHEMGNPLCSLEYLLSDLKEMENKGETQKAIELCLGEIDRMGRMLQRLRGLYRSSDGKKTLNNVNQLLEEILQVNRSHLLNKNILLEKYFDEKAPLLFVFSDQLKQVFMNIIINAIDAMQNGGLLKVNTQLSGDNIIITFTDNGIGIAKDKQEKIFTSFYTTKFSSNGLGLGLSVSSQIINAHGGKLWVESEEGKGASFFISLPIY